MIRLLFILTSRRPPRLTLSPYPALSRSLRRRRRAAGGVVPARQPRGGRSAAPPARHGPRAAARRGGAHRGLPRDRKSTRLNSSHANISNAVFCLKKKTVFCFENKNIDKY